MQISDPDSLEVRDFRRKLLSYIDNDIRLRPSSSQREQMLCREIETALLAIKELLTPMHKHCERIGKTHMFVISKFLDDHLKTPTDRLKSLEWEVGSTGEVLQSIKVALDSALDALVQTHGATLIAIPLASDELSKIPLNYKLFEESMRKEFAGLAANTESRVVASESQARTEVGKAIGTMNDKVREWEHVVDAMRDQLGKTSVTKQARHFLDAADVHERKAESALRVAVSTALFMGIIAYLTLPSVLGNKINPNSDMASLIQTSIAKAVIFSLLGFFVVLKARTHFAHRHNEVVNRHRANALETYTALVEAAKQEDRRDLILTKAAEAIFQPDASGFGKGESGNAAPMSIISVASDALQKGQ